VAQVIRFSIVGEPKPQGSKRVVPIMSKSGPVLRGGRILTRAIDDNPKLGEWRQEVAQAARAAYSGELLSGPIRLQVTFYRPRPRCHYRSGRHRGELKPSAPIYPTSRPDTLKLARAVEDSLSGVLWVDDSQVVVHDIHKLYGSHFQVDVSIERLEDV
jgi:Holliday junction resolvase RusA-like endonuclease